MKNQQNINIRSTVCELELKFQAFLNEKGEINLNKFDEVISELISFIKLAIKIPNESKVSKVTFLIGQTGSGKSTLLNYLGTPEDNMIVVEDETGEYELKTKYQCISEIGGSESTTIYPVCYQIGEELFIDFAGDCETGGIIMEIINSIIKSEISSNVQKVKIIFLTPFSTLTSDAAYGDSFKRAFKKNGEFLKDMDFFKNSIGVMVTKAPTRENSLSAVTEKLKRVSEHPEISHLKPILNKVIEKNHIEVFPKPSSNAIAGKQYIPPSWNHNQRQKISQFIHHIPETEIPYSGYLKVSTTEAIREAMHKSLELKEMKVKKIITQQIIPKTNSIDIFNVELETFANFINNLIKGEENITFIEFVQKLKKNNFLKLFFNDAEIEKLDEEVKFLSNLTQKFCDRENGNESQIKVDWSKKVNLPQLFDKIYLSVNEIILSNRNYVFEQRKVGSLSTLFVEQKLSNQITDDLMRLRANLMELNSIIEQSKDENSKYFTNGIRKEFSHYNTVSEMIPEEYSCNEEESYEVPAEYDYVAMPVTKTKPITKTKEVREKVTVVEVKKIRKCRNETYIDYQEKQRGGIAGLFGCTKSVPVEKQRQVHYWQNVPVEKEVEKTKNVEYIDYESFTDYENKWEKIKPARRETRTKRVIKVRHAKKDRQEAEFKAVRYRKLDEETLNKDKQKYEQKIISLRNDIEENIKKYPKPERNLNIKKMPIKINDSYEEKYKDLLELWRDAEYNAYCVKFPENELLKEINVNDQLTISQNPFAIPE